MQIVTWLPTPMTQDSSLFSGGRVDSQDLVKTETHYRTTDDYNEAAVQFGFRPSDQGVIETTKVPTSPFELDYQREPKFEFVEFQRI